MKVNSILSVSGLAIFAALPNFAFADGGLSAFLYGVPSAIPAPAGSSFVALSFSNPRGGIEGQDLDSDFALGYAFGNPVTGIGFNVGLDITGLQPFGDAGSFSIQASRMVLVTDKSATFAALAYSGLGAWGEQKGSEKASGFVTNFGTFDVGQTEVPYLLSVGYGENNTFAADGSGVLEDGIFWGGGIGLNDYLSASISGTSTQVNAGLSAKIPGLDNVSLSAGYMDVGSNVDRRQLTVTIGYNLTNLFGGS